jgi:K+-sensing histidine kinase KdpD
MAVRSAPPPAVVMPPAAEPEALPAGAPYVLAWIDGDSADLAVIERGRSLAAALGGRLTVLYVFSPGHRASNTTLGRARSLALASGAPLVEVPAYTALDGLVEFAAQRGATHLVLSCPERVLREGSFVEALADRLDRVDLYVLPRSTQLSHVT